VNQVGTAWVSGFLFPKGYYFYDRPNSQLRVLELVLFININTFGRFGGKIGEFGRNQPEKRTLLVMGADIEWN
jgi:hypothetical protein